MIRTDNAAMVEREEGKNDNWGKLGQKTDLSESEGF